MQKNKLDIKKAAKVTGRKLTAGMPGTKKLVEKFGEKLICVRYKYDAGKKIKYKTVELIVDQGFWEPDECLGRRSRKVFVKINYSETELRMRIKAAGGRWERDKKLWEIEYKKLKPMGMEDRICDV